MFSSKRTVVTLALFLVGPITVVALIARIAFESPPRLEAKEGEAARQSAARRRSAEAEQTTKQPCSVQAFDYVDVFPAVSGVLDGQSVDIGDRVKKGQVLARIEAPLLALEVKQAGALLKQVKAQVLDREAHVAAAQAEVQAEQSLVRQRQGELDQAKALARLRRRQHERYKEMYENRAINVALAEEKEELLLAARAQVVAAGAALANARAHVEVRRSHLAQAEAALTMTRCSQEAAEAVLEKARYALNLTQIVSPVEGVVTRLNYRNGHYLRSSGQGERMALLTIEITDRVRVVVDVPDRYVRLTQPGAPVDLTIDALPDVRFSGYKISRIGFAENPLSHTMRVEIDVPNPKQLLHSGMSGAAVIHLLDSGET